MRWVSLILLVLSPLTVSCSTAFTGDPFGAPPKGAIPNCGPEHRYKYDLRIHSKEEFVEFIREHGSELADDYGRKPVTQLDNFREITPGMTPEELAHAPVAWERVLDAVTTEKIGKRIIYVLDFSPHGCRGRYTLKMTDAGHVSLYGCCGI